MAPWRRLSEDCWTILERLFPLTPTSLENWIYLWWIIVGILQNPVNFKRAELCDLQNDVGVYSSGWYI